MPIETVVPGLLSFVFLVLACVLFFGHGKYKLAISALLVANFLLSTAFALLDPFLNLWDEQFHALVAKNMVGHPFRPMLYANPVLGPGGLNWTSSHIWLHKQPLFLWQMALSMKLFGVSVFAVRLPSVVMHCLAAFFIYRIGKISMDEKTGFVAAALFSFTHYPLELIAGLYHTDHNDMAFLCYVGSSFWAWFEYRQSKNKWWILAIGVFSGAAVLVKWLTGLLALGAWGAVVLWERDWKEVGRLLFAMLIATVVFLPWQVYVLLEFPAEAAHEYRLNSLHFFGVVEEHVGDAMFHWAALEKLYAPGDAMPFVLLAGFVFLVFRLRDRGHKVFIVASVAAVYAFFTLATTKMVSFTLIASPFLFLGLANLLVAAFHFLGRRLGHKNRAWVFQAVTTVVVCIVLLDVSRAVRQHTLKDPAYNNKRSANLEELAFILSMDLALPDERYVIFNANTTDFGHIPFMFHRDFAAAYPFTPTQAQLDTVINKGFVPLVLCGHTEWIRKTAPGLAVCRNMCNKHQLVRPSFLSAFSKTETFNCFNTTSACPAEIQR